MTTDTPRTDAAWNTCGEPYLFARQLERELAASSAEVERLDHLLADASETNHKLGVEVLVLKKKLAALRSEKNACLDGNAYYGSKIGILNDRINRVLDILTERIK